MHPIERRERDQLLMEFESDTDTVASAVFRKNKREAACHVKSLCDSLKELETKEGIASNSALLHEKRLEVAGIFDTILEPGKFAINDWGMLDWCKCFIASGNNFDDFVKTVRLYDSAQTCGLVWTPNFVAYRCRTCGLSPCMSLCSECFLSGNHEGHDFNMFRSQAGGACDCGDHSVMKESGFCRRHGAGGQTTKPAPPCNLLSVAEFMLPKLFCRLLCHFRDSCDPTSSTPLGHQQTAEQAEGLLDLLQCLAEMGAAARHVVTKCLLSLQGYTEMFDDSFTSSSSNSSKKAYMARMHSSYERCLKLLESICQDDDDDFECASLSLTLKHSTIVEELTYWLVVLEFPQKLVTFLLSMLPNPDYKDAFADAFVTHYSRMASLLATQRDLEQTSNRMIHISVQLLSNGELSQRLTEKHRFLRLMVLCLNNMIKRCLISSTIHTQEDNLHLVCDCSHALMQNHNYWALISDLHNLLSHEAIAKQFLRDPLLIDLWCGFLTCFQGMNLNHRQLDEHVQIESRSYYAAFTAEIEACASTLWSLLQHCTDQSSEDCLLYMLQSLSGALQEWFESINFVPDSCWKPPPLQLSFHLPLHRYYAAFLCHALKLGASVLFPSESLLRQMMMHPLQIQVRSGTVIKYQSCLYVQSHFCAGFVDLDLFLLQACAARVHPDWFVLTVFQQFHMAKWLSFSENKPLKPFLRPEWEMPMLEAALRLLAMTVCNTNNLGMSEPDVMRLELATLLCMGDKTHSQLIEQMPDKGITAINTSFEQILNEVADYRTPQFDSGSTLRQGTYSAKDAVWEQYFDPLFVFLRSLQVKEYQAALDKYTEYMKRSGKFKGKGNLWPPFRLPHSVLPVLEPIARILHCRSLFAIVYVILFRTLKDTSATVVSEEAFSLAVLLLDLAINFSSQTAETQSERMPGRRTVLDSQFCGWFPSTSVLTNLCHKLDRLIVVDNLPGLSRAVTDETDCIFPDLLRLRRTTCKDSSATHSSEVAVVPTVRRHSVEIPFIDCDVDVDGEIDYYYSRVMACLPPSVRCEYLSESPIRPALTFADENIPYVTEANTDDASSSEDEETHRAPQTSARVAADAGRRPSDAPNASALPALPRPSDAAANSRQQVQHPESSEDEAMDTSTSAVHHAASAPSLLSDYTTGKLKASSSRQPSLQASLVVKRPVPLSVRLPARVASSSLRGLPTPKQQERLPRSSDPPRALPSPSVQCTEMDGESVLSILVKLYKRISGGQNYELPAVPPLSGTTNGCSSTQSASRIMDGAAMIKSVLDRAAILSVQCREQLSSICTVLNRAEPKDEAHLNSKEAKKQAARERQERLMAQFSSKQKAVLKQLIEKEQAQDVLDAGASNSAAEMLEENSLESSSKAMHDERFLACVICNQSTPLSNPDRSIGLIVLAQSTNVLAKQQTAGSCVKDLTTPSSSVCADVIDRSRIEWEMTGNLRSNFNALQCANAVCSVSGSIAVQTCGHYIHTACHSSYMQALKRDLQQLNHSVIQVLAGEFYCPLCRQMANAVLPLFQSSVFPKALPADSLSCSELTSFVFTSLHCSETSSSDSDELSDTLAAVSSFINLLRNLTYKQYLDGPNETGSLFLVACIKTNLELWIMLKEAKLLQVKRWCIGSLINLAAIQLLITKPANSSVCEMLWSRLTNVHFRSPGSCLSLVDANVPILLHDQMFVLLQLVLTLVSANRNAALFPCVFSPIFNAVCIQSCLSVLCGLSADNRAAAFNAMASFTEALDVKHLSHLFVFLLRRVSLNAAFAEALSADATATISKTKVEVDCSWPTLLQRVYAGCLPFLRFAASLKHFVYGFAEDYDERMLCFEDPLDSQFTRLHAYCCASTCVLSEIKCRSSLDEILLSWTGNDVLDLWLSELCFSKTTVCTKSLAYLSMQWKPSKLLRLPTQYDSIFQNWHQAVCEKCGKVPKESLLCLVCGRLICYKDTCCTVQNMSELEMHTIDCGAGTGVYLWIHTTLILIVRGKRVAQWGSVYLDAYGEEDFSLRRGKPLFLSQDRFALLEQQWQVHIFDWACRNWSWVSQNPATANVIIL